MRTNHYFVIALAGTVSTLVSLGFVTGVQAAPQPPNILWISCEDISCDLGCYGVSVSQAT